MRNIWRICLVMLTMFISTMGAAQQQSTGLEFLNPQQYSLIPRTKAPVGGSEKELPNHVDLANKFPGAQFQGLTSKACAAFAVIVECPVIFGPVHMRETLSQGAGHGTKEEAHI
jgi:hypothetical protein